MPTSAPDASDLAGRIAELEAENERLRADREGGDPSPRQPRKGRAVLSAALIVVGLVLGVIGVGASYAKNMLTDTDLFVATLAPLADDPQIQAVIITSVTDAIDESVDIPALTATAFDGLDELDLSPRARSALNLLQGPINQGLQALIDDFVTTSVRSPAFSDIWAATVRGTHTQLVATMQHDPGTAVTISADGALELQLGSIIAEVRSRLIANDVRIAEAIPAVDRSIVIIQHDSLGTLTTVYALTAALGSWLPWVAVALLAGGVLLANHRRRALTATAIATAALMALLGVGLAVGRTVAVGMLARESVTPGAVTAVYDALTASAASTVLALGALAIVVVIVAWASGRARAAELLRASVGHAASAARSAAERHDISSGASGRWLERHHLLAVTVIGTIAAVVILFTRPLTITTILWTVVIAGIALLLVQFLRRPEPVPANEEPDDE